MKRNLTKRTLGILLSLLLLLGALPLVALPVAAQNITGLMYASTVIADRGVVLMGNTRLHMDIDLTVPYIEGDYNLTIDGSGTLTINGSGTGIDVKSLDCSANLFIQTGWHGIEVTDSLYIQNANTFVNGGIYADGAIEIQSNDATITGNGNAISSTGGNITLSGGAFYIGANGVAVYAEVGEVYMTGDFQINSNNGRTIDARKGAVTIDGSLKSTSGEKFDPDVHFINRDNFSIGAAGGFNFYGTTLEVTGLGGILAGNHSIYTDISITADSVSIITERYYALYGGYIYIDSDELWLENQGSEEDENVKYTFDTIIARKDATLYSESGGIVGENCVDVGGNLTLNGTFAVGADEDVGEALQANGRMDVTGDLTVYADSGCIDAIKGFTFNGGNLKLDGRYGICVEEGDVNITAESTNISGSATFAIAGDTNTDGIKYPCNVYIDSDYLMLQGAKNTGLSNWAAIDTYGDVTIYADEAHIYGDYGIRTEGDIMLEGAFTVLGYNLEAVKGNIVNVKGSLSVQTEGAYSCLTAQEFTFDGTTLTADGYSGIWGRFTEINTDSVVITTSVGDALDGDEVYVTANYLWAENKATKVDSDWQDRGGTQFGIAAESKLALNVKGGTVIGYDHALACYDRYDKHDIHYVYVNGHITAVSRIGAGVYVQDGTAEFYDGSIVSVGETHGIDATDVFFEGGSLRAEGNTGIHAVNSVELSGEDVRITAFGERSSGIWTENGYVDLAGKIAIETGGWYGINSATDVSFHEGYFTIGGPEGNAQAVKLNGDLYMHGTLEIVKPIYGHVNGNDIYGTGDSPAMELEMYSAIPEVSLFIDRPREGELPTRNASGIYFLDPRCTVEEIVWYEDGEEMVSQDAVFRAGHRYTVEITISANGVYYFLEGVMGKVNDKAVSTGTSQKKIMYLTADMGECPKAVSMVELEITAPVEGKCPSTSVTDPNPEYGVYSRDVRWAVSTDGINYLPMADGEKFVGGKYYRVFMDVNLAGKDYKFPVTTASGSVQPDVISYVNGNPAVTEKAYDQDPETVITVYFDFGKCNDFIIEEITIVDVVAPVAGQHPTYTANMFGTGYHIDTTRNAYEDIYWKNPPEKWYYLKNGVQWWDVTTGCWEYVYERDTFLSGHTYVCQLYLAVEDGFTFTTDGALQAAVNGNAAELNEGWTNMWEARVTYTFTCEENVVDRIVVDGITAPKKGQTPDYSPILDNPDLYALDTDYGLNGSGIYWYDCEGRQLEAGEVFGDAGPYRMAIKFVPAYDNGAPLCAFADDADVMINGKYVTPYVDWDNIVVGNGAVWAFYTFRSGTSAPEGEQTYTLSGTINVSGATVTLLRGDDVVATAVSDPAYRLDNLAIGVYTLQVSRDGYAPVEYSIVIAADAVQDVTLVSASIPGDANRDGVVNNRDLALMQQYINKWDVTIDTAAADVNKDGAVNNRDLALLQQYINKWDVVLK